MVKHHKAMLYTNFHASEPSGSEDEDFLNIFMYFYGSNRGPLAGAILDLRTFALTTFGKGLTGNVTYQILST